MKKILWSAALFSMVAMALAGCSETGSNEASMAILDQDAGPEDGRLPAEYPMDGSTVDQASFRHSATAAGREFQIGRSKDGKDVCLVVMASQDDDTVPWSVNCASSKGIGSEGLMFTGSNQGFDFALARDGADMDSYAQNGWKQIHENIWIHQ